MRIQPKRTVRKQWAIDLLVLVVLIYFLAMDILETRPLPYWGWQGF
jgi:hypothetical protein